MKRSYRGATMGSVLLASAKAVLLSCILTAVLVLLLAITMKWEWVAMDGVALFSTLIKALSACFTGLLISCQNISRRWVLAGVAGMVYMIVSFAVFGILNGSFAVSFGNAADVLMAFACAACTCILATMLRERQTVKQ